MARAVIRLGDDTSHGGKVITASARMTIDGIPVALWGDRCSCPIDGHDTCVICEGEPEALYDGIPVALEGHKTDCGAVLIPSQLQRCNVSPLVKAEAMVPPYGEPKVPPDGKRDLEQRFRVTDGDGNPVCELSYTLSDGGGVIAEGRLDVDGSTKGFPIDTQLKPTFWLTRS